MSSLIRNSIVLVLLSYCAALTSPAHAQTKTPRKTATGSVSGRVTVAGKGRAGIVVALRTNPFSPPSMRPYKAVTDADGNYRIVDLPPGSYYVAPMSVLFVLSDSNPVSQFGTPLLLSDGESVNDINFAMSRGCVITGKVTDADGRPVVEQLVNVIAVEQPNQRSFYPGRMPFHTDDRGVYRIFGLRAGRYKVGVGQADDGYMGAQFGRSGYQPAFYPNVTSADEAKIVELAEGDQAKNIDIVMSRTLPGFAATGTIIDGETNLPINGLRVGLQKRNDERNSFVPVSGMSNQRGEFRLENVPPGKYALYLASQENLELRADPVEFQLVDQDVTGLVIRTMRGATVSGTVVVEGTNDQSVMAKVRELRIYAWVQGASGGGRPSPVSADGGFRLTGLAAGVANFEVVGADYNQQTGLIMSRIERDGVVVPRSGFEIKPGEQISGVRMVLIYGSGSVLGTVTFENGPPVPGMRFVLRLNKPGDREVRLPSKEVDARGRFLIEGVPPGTYDLSVTGFNPGGRERQLSATQSITVTDGAVTDVVISLDLARHP